MVRKRTERMIGQNLSSVLENLKVGRDGAVLVCRDTKPFGPEYKKAHTVIEAIDDLVGDLTGDREMFYLKGHG